MARRGILGIAARGFLERRSSRFLVLLNGEVAAVEHIEEGGNAAAGAIAEYVEGCM